METTQPVPSVFVLVNIYLALAMQQTQILKTWQISQYISQLYENIVTHFSFQKADV